MTANGLLQIAVYFAVLLLLVKPLGLYMARVYQHQPVGLERVLRPLERLIYRLGGVRPDEEMTWQQYAGAMLLLGLCGMLSLYGLLRVQGALDVLNPRHWSALPPEAALNTAVSFTTNTNWQNYSGETTLSYLTQMVGLTVHNFLSAATGMAVLVALIRGLVRRSVRTLGNFWVDLVRSTLYILLPLALVLAVVLVAQGVPQTLGDYVQVPLLQAVTSQQPPMTGAGNRLPETPGDTVPKAATATAQTLAVGPVASQVAIKHLGTNGGGFFNANAAHPFESPTPLTDFLLVLAQTLIPAALTYTFGRMVGDTRQGWALLAAMLILLGSFVLGAYYAETRPNPHLAALGRIDQTASVLCPGGNMEGKEVRFGPSRSALFAATTTATSCGAVDATHDSFTPLGGLVPLALIQLGEVVLGGVGSGLYGMLVFAMVAVFMAGLMVGRTPEYLGKKIEAFEMKMAALLILIMPLIVLVPTAVAAVYAPALAARGNPGPHGFSEILYAFSSMGNNNGSAFAGLDVNGPFYNVVGAVVMLLGRFWMAVPTLALAGALARKRHIPQSPGTLPTHTPLFVALLIGVVLILGLLTFVPALALGPVVEHLMAW